ncbi:MAG: enoyl-CoA hydratase-related protein [Wenzhouxiangellaceae bacterium]
MSEYTSLRIERNDEFIAELILTGPGHGNAVGPDFWREFPRAVETLNTDRDVRCLIVRGDGEHFCYGLDLQEMVGEVGTMLNDGAAGRAAIVRQAAKMVAGFDALASGRLPVVAAVDGWCIGAGVELIAACDIRVASSRAQFALREVKVGMVPDLGGIARLPHLIGEGWTRELALTGDPIDAETACRAGLVNRVLEGREALLTHARELAGRIAANPPLVVGGIRQVMNARVQGAVADGNREAATLNGMLMQSEDFAEAMRAFMEKRAPQFKGR